MYELYGSNQSQIYELGKKLMDDYKASKKSLETPRFKKSKDNRETINLVVDRLTELYGVEASLVNNSEMKALSEELNTDLTNARAFAIPSKGQIFINVDKASIAEPLHELAHILMPGLKAKNPRAYNTMMSKIKDHPSYKTIAENYSGLSEEDLDEEVFVTIFAEYFREKMLSKEQNNWLSEEFVDFTDNTSKVVSELFDNEISVSSYSVMNMTLEEIMDEFGSRMLSGDLQKYYKTSTLLSANSMVQKIYKSLIDKGKLIKKC